jgi:hypothetical protein
MYITMGSNCVPLFVEFFFSLYQFTFRFIDDVFPLNKFLDYVDYI